MTQLQMLPLDFCLLIPCFNDEEGLVYALRSIHYAAGKMAALVVDDGSAPALMLDVLKKAAPQISNLYLLRCPENRGITNALNAGLRWIVQNTAAPLIARLDCGDSAHENRFTRQVTFLKTHAAVGLLGSWCRFTSAGGRHSYLYKTPVQHGAILKEMHLRNVFLHPGVMFRTGLLKTVGLYPAAYPHAEDYAFFWKLLQQAQGYILPEVLTTCLLRTAGLSGTYRRQQLLARKKVVGHFGTNPIWKAAGIFKLYILLITPKGLVLRLKMWRGGWFETDLQE